MKKVYEFLLWDNCSNNCRFCWQRENPRIYNKEERESILQETLKFILSNKFEEGSHILVCGGELFDKPQDFSALNLFFENISDLMVQNTIELLYINTNLIYKDIRGVLGMLKILNQSSLDMVDLIPRIRFTTSYDIEGRFRNKDSEDIMLANLKYITDKYPDMPVVVNTILTKPTCEAILSGKFNINEFMNKYNCWVNLLPYIVLDNDLTASRTLIFQTLDYVNKICPGYLEKYVPNMCITQEKWLYMFKNNEFQFCSCELSECGHSVNFKKYSEQGTCFCCDLQEIFGEYI